MPIRPSQAPSARPRRTWLWLLLAAWLLTQSWAWMHRVEHGQQLAGIAVAAQGHGTHDAATDGLHAGGADCEWLDHALLGAAAGMSPLPLTLLVFGDTPATLPAASNAPLRSAHSYLARAPPATGQTTATPGQTAG
ncbi:MAG: hypothetical protein RLZZ271_552 [Pseudomonadota bacterium]|jgi:hypothetical protein